MAERDKTMRKRLIPKIRVGNYHKTVPASKGIWTKWFHVEKFWGGSIIQIQIKHYFVSLDFRKSWVEDMRHYPQDLIDAAEKAGE